MTTYHADTHYPIPGTQLTATFLGAGPGGYSPIFYGASEGTAAMGSVNAGNSDMLYVGGGGINGAFGSVLQATQDINLYQTRHQTLYQQATSGGAAEETYSATDPTSFSVVQPKLVSTTPKAYDGIAFVDVFGDGLAPNGNAHNSAMVYAAPPYGPRYDNDADFLTAIQTTAPHIAESVQAFNAAAKKPGSSLTPLRVLRLSLYSSNIYNRTPAVSLDLIAMAIYDGLLAALSKDDAGLMSLEFPVAKGEFSAVEKRLKA